ncbi:hypothetical protein HYC85_009355 [Camellia sinensis]|uniref:Magnesium transporter n=1 Tax=Camellia sinensis TaxID=4442 RepID=A0A7J7HGP2_CAMSI|nr:hypothetical protein HYC85_009355 [Camellia sinensis]
MEALDPLYLFNKGSKARSSEDLVARATRHRKLRSSQGSLARANNPKARSSERNLARAKDSNPQISTHNLDQVRKLKSAMTRLTARVQKVRDELEQLLDDDDDMADLYLSRKLAGPSSPVSGLGAANWCPASPTIGSKKSRARRASVATFRGDENDVEELEMLLELREFIDDTEDYINIQLDNHRNQLIQLELLLTSAGISVSLCSTMAGIFGANIPFTWNSNHGYMFKWYAYNFEYKFQNPIHTKLDTTLSREVCLILRWDFVTDKILNVSFISVNLNVLLLIVARW